MPFYRPAPLQSGGHNLEARQIGFQSLNLAFQFAIIASIGRRLNRSAEVRQHGNAVGPSRPSQTVSENARVCMIAASESILHSGEVRPTTVEIFLEHRDRNPFRRLYANLFRFHCLSPAFESIDAR